MRLLCSLGHLDPHGSQQFVGDGAGLELGERTARQGPLGQNGGIGPGPADIDDLRYPDTCRGGQ